MSRTLSLLLLGFTLSLSHCALMPQGEKALREDLKTANDELGIDSQNPPRLSSPVSKEVLLEHILLTNGTLRAKYYQWQAAYHRLKQVAAYPNTNIAPEVAFQTSPSTESAFNRTEIRLGFDPMLNLRFPGKVRKEAQIALVQARITGSEFQELKLSLRKDALALYFDLVFLQERILIENELVSLFEFLTTSLQGRTSSGTSEAVLLQGELQSGLARNELQNLIQEQAALRVKVNGLLRREPEASLELMPEAISDEDLDLSGYLKAGVKRNPRLEALSHAVEGAEHEVQRALLEFVPDINPSFIFIGNAERAVGAMVALPTTITKLQAAVNEARMRLRAIQSIQAQQQSEENAAFASTVIALLNAEREYKLYRDILVPLASRFAALSEERFLVGSLDSKELIEALEIYFEVKTSISAVKREHDLRFTELETLAGFTYQEYVTQFKSDHAQWKRDMAERNGGEK